MDQKKSGQLIARKRKELNLTQAELAEKIGVSNKSVSKWECGRCLPDYSLVEPLCRELKISAAELLSGEDAAAAPTPGDQQALEIIRRLQTLEKEKQVLAGILLIVLGIALLALSPTMGGSPLRDFLSGLALGLSIGCMLVGVVVTVRSLVK